MHVAIQVDDPVLTEAFKSYIERRLRFALGRYGGRVSQIAVRVGADGHNARRCRITAEALPFGRVAVEEFEPTYLRRLIGQQAELAGYSAAS